MNLSLDDHWINNISYIINRNKTIKFNLTRFFIHFNNCDVTTERISEIYRVIKAAEIKTRLKCFRIMMWYISSKCNITKSSRMMDQETFNHEFSITKLNIIKIGFELVSRNLFALFYNFFNAFNDRSSTHSNAS